MLAAGLPGFNAHRQANDLPWNIIIIKEETQPPKPRFIAQWCRVKISKINRESNRWLRLNWQSNRIRLRLHFVFGQFNRLRLPHVWSDVLERQGLFLNLLSKLVMSLHLEKHFVVPEYFSGSLKVLEQLCNCSLLNYCILRSFKIKQCNGTEYRVDLFHGTQLCRKKHPLLLSNVFFWKIVVHHYI